MVVTMKNYQAKVPVRIEFGGVDTTEQIHQCGYGVALNCNINKFAYAEINDSGEYDKKNVLIDAVLKNCYYGEEKLGAKVHADFPQKSGLGGSSAIVVALIKALYGYSEIEIKKHDLADLAIKVERKILEHPGGIQDQHSASFGGFNYFVFKDEPEFSRHAVYPIKFPKNFAEDFQNSLVCYILPRTTSGLSIHEDMQKNPASKGLLMTKIALINEEKYALEHGELVKFSECLNRLWQLKKLQNPDRSNHFIDCFAENCLSQKGTLGFRISGAGGGGCATIITTQPDELKKYIREVYKLNSFDIKLNIGE